VVLVGAGLLVTKSLSNTNKKTEVAVENPVSGKTDKKDKNEKELKEPKDENDDAGGATDGSSESTSGSESGITMPSELTTAGSGVNLAFVGLLAGVAVYVVFLKLDLRVKE
jgi:hypothetical protein